MLFSSVGPLLSHPNGTVRDGWLTSSSQFDEAHGTQKAGIYVSEPPAAWCPGKYIISNHSG